MTYKVSSGSLSLYSLTIANKTAGFLHKCRDVLFSNFAFVYVYIILFVCLCVCVCVCVCMFAYNSGMGGAIFSKFLA